MINIQEMWEHCPAMLKRRLVPRNRYVQWRNRARPVYVRKWNLDSAFASAKYAGKLKTDGNN